jgi:flagellar basal-body rod modification protein FlgD
MMNISAVNSAALATTAGASDAEKAKLDYDSFLRLLVAEMKNQDPTEPRDTSQYISQLASFSAVEQGVNTNKRLDSLMTQMQLVQADSLIGHTLTGADGLLLGTIKSVEIGKAVSTAILESGARVVLDSGITIG